MKKFFIINLIRNHNPHPPYPPFELAIFMNAPPSSPVVVDDLSELFGGLKLSSTPKPAPHLSFLMNSRVHSKLKAFLATTRATISNKKRVASLSSRVASTAEALRLVHGGSALANALSSL